MSNASSSDRSALPWLWLSVLLIGLDQLSKLYFLELLADGRVIPVIDGFWNWKLAFNYGAAFSFLADAAGWQRWFFTVLALGVSALLVHWLRRLSRGQWREAMPYALIIAGALGNLVDRLRFGYVVDFVHWYWRDFHWPIFNVADSAIVVGAAMLVLLAVFPEKRSP